MPQVVMTDGDVRKVQTQLLERVAAFCESQGITYYLHAGTLLGAVRHQGFIPWDDDVDLAMLRPDYERFCREFRADGAELYAMNTRADYAYPWAKVSDPTTRIADGAAAAGDGIGVNIDVFPIDGWPEGRRAIAHRLNLRVRHTLYAIHADLRNPGRVGWKNRIIKTCCGVVRRLFTLRGLSERIEKVATRFPPTRHAVGVVVFSKLQWVEREAYDQPALTVTFEGAGYPAPKDTDRVLTNHYGDYMTPPPEAERWSDFHVVGAEWVTRS